MSEVIKFSREAKGVYYIRAHECRELSPLVILGTAGIYDKHRLDLMLKLSSKANFVDGLANLERKTRYTLKIVEGVRACGMTLAVKPILAQ
jgi:hypothetical protein